MLWALDHVLCVSGVHLVFLTLLDFLELSVIDLGVFMEFYADCHQIIMRPENYNSVADHVKQKM